MKRVRSECKGGLDHTRGNFAASAAFTSATVATSAGFSSLSETGKPRRSVDLPAAAMVSESIERNRDPNTVRQFPAFIYLFISEQVVACDFKR